MAFALLELSQQLGAELKGDGTVLLSDVASLPLATSEHLAYVESKKQITAAKSSPAGALITTSELAEMLSGQATPLLIVARPQKAFIEAMLLFRPAPQRPAPTISENAVVSPSARFGEGCRVGPNAVIGDDVVIGDHCEIGPGAVIADGSRIGNHCKIYSNVVFYSGVELKDRVIIHANAVIGGDGFGYRFEQGAFIKIPHTGKVILEDDVEIGACTTIDRGMIDSTIIGQGTKIDNQVMIAHNCRIGRNNVFASQVGLAGSVTTGEYVQMGGKVGIADHIHIGTQVKLGGNTGVLSDITVPGAYYDSPAVPEKEALRNHVNIRRLPEMRDQIKQLAQQMAALQAQLSSLQEPPSSKVAA
ncbi:MAG TPA: UDP-3-O-(3-hydroxymyristoyl)glucosamine N-acyltransferase [Planctomicrobium sp.]|nr:UDP-3-O-(3-hydroxymyristoyl)glucosamine N-acyltransferase [Planctomicrobium sp.]